MTGFGDFVSYLDSFGLVGAGIFLAWAFYTEKLRFGKDFDDLEEELTACRAEIRKLWEEKLVDKDKAANIAQAYVAIREREKP